jgi:hypothetical protein
MDEQPLFDFSEVEKLLDEKIEYYSDELLKYHNEVKIICKYFLDNAEDIDFKNKNWKENGKRSSMQYLLFTAMNKMD